MMPRAKNAEDCSVPLARLPVVALLVMDIMRSWPPEESEKSWFIP
jgi:hypothetical protein